DAIATLDRKEVRDLEIAVLKERMPLLVKAGIAESEIGSWFRQAEITEIEDQLIVTLPNSFIAGRVKENYLKQLQRHCTKTIRIEQKPGKS
ncbi:MAG: DnaA N-terminal domain-containing protein, partial [Sneathiella sp.]